jgi:dihydroneopterin aldolase
MAVEPLALRAECAPPARNVTARAVTQPAGDAHEAGWMLSDALGLRRRAGRGPSRFYRVFVRDLVLPFSIGVHEHEKRARQRVRVNAELLVRTSAAENDRLDDVLNYETIVNGIRRIAEAGHVHLVETLAENVAELCLYDPRVMAVRVGVEKLDVFADAQGVGVIIKRRRR